MSPVSAQSNADNPGAGSFGRVAEDGTVYVRIGDAEHSVGQYPEGSPAEAMAFFTKRYDSVAFEVRLIEQRVHAGTLSPREATESIDKLSAQLENPNFVGDVLALRGRLALLRPLIGQQKVQRREDRARKVEEARARKQAIVTAAEKIAAGRDWRTGAQKLRDLMTEWKALARLDKASDDELWHRFSAARTTYTKARKLHFAEDTEKRESARVAKEKLIRAAEALSDSTDWGATSAEYRRLMQDWKAAGMAPRDADEKLWKRFRAAQDKFFEARTAADAEQDREFEANAEVKRALLVEAEALLPVRDLDAAKRAFREIADKWDEAGKVPRDQMKSLEGRIRKVEQAIRDLEDKQWQRSDPEKSARADGMIEQLRTAIAKLEDQLAKAQAGGDDRAAKKLQDELAGKRSFLEMAQKAAADFS